MKNPSRKYIDLIFQLSGKWANWDPPRSIRVGDYGTIDRRTGNLEVKGNVYDDPIVGNLLRDYPVEESDREDSFCVSTQNATRKEIQGGPDINVVGIVEVGLSGHWTFGSHSGALLLVQKPRMLHMPNKGLEKLSQVDFLKKKVIVTVVMETHAYSMYFSTGGNESVSIALTGSVPAPAVPGLAAGGEVRLGWSIKYGRGLFRSACNESSTFTPLYALKQPKTFLEWLADFGRRDADQPANPDSIWVDVEPPWDPLDSDGEEDPIDSSLEPKE